jgi:hypothetical protein
MTLLQQLADARFGSQEAAKWNNHRAAQHYRDLADRIAERLVNEVIEARTARKAA